MTLQSKKLDTTQMSLLVCIKVRLHVCLKMTTLASCIHRHMQL